MSTGAVIILVALIIGYYWLRDTAGRHAQHKRVISAKCSCGHCHEKKSGGKH